MKETPITRKQSFKKRKHEEKGLHYQNNDFFNDEECNIELTKIANWLKKLRFRKKVFGGVSAQDVWKKISELNAMYEDALTAERIRYATLLEHEKKAYNADKAKAEHIGGSDWEIEDMINKYRLQGQRIEDRGKVGDE